MAEVVSRRERNALTPMRKAPGPVVRAGLSVASIAIGAGKLIAEIAIDEKCRS